MQIWNRETGQMETEKVYGDRWIRLAYETAAGRFLLENWLTRRGLTRSYGSMQDSPKSGKKVAPFIKKFEIPIDEYQVPKQGFATFNEFFIRQFKPGQRPFAADPKVMPAFAEARYYAFAEVPADQRIPIKGTALSALELLADFKRAQPFIGGPVLLARLCPVDYHRYHYPLDGTTLESGLIPGKFHSVNPVALKAIPDLFLSNERRVSILDTKDFGKLAYVEVGALCVGKIVQSHDEKIAFRRGDEKGYFLFGGSTVIVLGEKGKWTPDQDLLEKTKAGIEARIKLGTAIAHRI